MPSAVSKRISKVLYSRSKLLEFFFYNPSTFNKDAVFYVVMRNRPQCFADSGLPWTPTFRNLKVDTDTECYGDREN